MKRLIGAILCLCFFFFGCARSVYKQESRFHSDGRAKPIITVVPVFDRSSASVGWDLSEEFTDHLKQKLLKTSQFYLKTPEEINPIIAHFTPEHNPFDRKVEWIESAFAHSEFVVFTEIVEHAIHPRQPTDRFFDKLTPSNELTVTVRLRVFDLRGSQAEVILEEMVSQSHFIPNAKGLATKSPNYWQRVSFGVSPIGLAHAQIVREVAKQIGDYILLAQSR